MSKVLRLTFVVLMTLSICVGADAGQAQQTDSLAGDWIARLDLASRPAFLQIAIRPNRDKAWTASVTLLPIAAVSQNTPESRRIAESWRNASLSVDGATWRVLAGTGSDSIQIEASHRGPTATAKVIFRNVTVPTVLRHLAAVEKSREQRYVGVYVLQSGERIYIWRPSSAGALTYLEEATGRSGTLYPIGSDSYIAGPTTILPDPVHVRATFRDRSDGMPQVVWQRIGKEEMVATRSPAFRREEAELKGPAGVLGCDLLMPVDGRKHAAAVLIPGAGANDRNAVYLIAQTFAEHGVAALTCDKRGTGKSEGDWRLTSFEQQAQDVAAGIRFLRGRTEVDPQRVGVWGFSEGAWVAPLVVSHNPEVSFMILAAAPVTSRRESLLIGNEDRLRQAGASAAEISRNRDFNVRYQDAIMRKDASGIEALWREFAAASWLPANMPTAQSLKEWSWERARLTWPYEPGPVLSTIKCPVLAVWGAEDSVFPARINLPLLEKAMGTARNPDYTLREIPGADHSMRLVAESFVEETGYAPAYFQTMLKWLRARVVK